MLPQNTYLGELTYLEIYEFYDIPALYVCGNKTGHIFISVWIEETDDATQWLFAPISRQRFHLLRSGKIDLHDLFQKPEDGFCFLVSISSQTESDSVSELSAAQITDEMVPQPDSYIKDVTKLPMVMWGSLDQESGSSNIVDKWLANESNLIPS